MIQSSGACAAGLLRALAPIAVLASQHEESLRLIRKHYALFFGKIVSQRRLQADLGFSSVRLAFGRDASVRCGGPYLESESSWQNYRVLVDLYLAC